VVVELPGVAPLDLLLKCRLLRDQRIEIGIGIAEGFVDGVVPGKQVNNGLNRFLHHLAHSLVVVQMGLLLQKPDRVTLGHRDLANVILVDTRHNAQQRRLSGPIQSQDTDLGAIEKAQ